jgi:hypothetical protein
MARKVYHSVPTKDGWAVKQSGKTVSNHNTQKASEAAAAAAGRRAEKQGGLGQAVLHRADGVIKTEWTYGKDPRDIKG